MTFDGSGSLFKRWIVCSSDLMKCSKGNAIAGLLSTSDDAVHTALINMMRIRGNIKARKNSSAISKEIIIDEVTTFNVKAYLRLERILVWLLETIEAWWLSGSASRFHATGQWFKSRAGKGRLGLSPLQWVDKGVLSFLELNTGGFVSD
ncbi:hypothetical protein TNCV_3636231 [Trichonephila clavipes]|nr:hypothetical protein TNCV_3636231 [Trichonephila clavipes]